MKTTIDIGDALLARAKRLARRKGTTLRALVEEGLRRVLDGPPTSSGFKLPDCAVGDAQAANPLERFTWQDLRDEIYGGR